MKAEFVTDELEKAVEDACKDAGMSPQVAIPVSRLATAAICSYLIGSRVSFGPGACRKYRDRAIYELRRSGNSEELARAEGLTSRQIRNIVAAQHRKRRDK